MIASLENGRSRRYSRRAAIHRRLIGVRSQRDGAVNLSVVVPLFNEEERLDKRYPLLLDWLAAKSAPTELILVDDGSRDATRAVARSVVARARKLRIEARLVEAEHLGKGAAVAAGLARSRGAYAGFCDVDLSTPLEHFDTVIRAAFSGGVLAIASRAANGAIVTKPESKLREGLGCVYNRLLQATLVPGISDTQCGAKAAPTELWQTVVPYCHESGWAWDVELVAISRRLGFPVEEVPVNWHHDTGSRLNVLSAGTQLLAAVPRIWLNMRSLPAPVPSSCAGLNRVVTPRRISAASLEASG